MSDKTLRAALVAHEKKVVDMVLSCYRENSLVEVPITSQVVLDSRDAFLAALADSADTKGKDMNILAIPMRESIQMALDELGEPRPEYPQPVANAVEILRNALADTPAAILKKLPSADAPEGPWADRDRLRAALIEHRADLHGGSTRPCATCRQSAEALGIEGLVPGQCSRGETDRIALNRLDAQQKP